MVIEKPVIRLYRVPFDAFEPAEDEEMEDAQSDGESDRDGFTVV